MKTVTTKAKITGRVQGVGFRWWTQARAEALGLTGWVRNDPTGSVSAVFHGPQDQVETMIKELWSGPGAANVRDVQTSPELAVEPLEGFQIRR